MAENQVNVENLEGLFNEEGGLDPSGLRQTLLQLKAGLNSISDSSTSQHEGLEAKMKEQEKLIAEQAAQLANFAEDRAALQTSQLVARDSLRKSEKTTILAKHSSLAVKEKLDVYLDLMWELQDVFESCEGILPSMEDLLKTDGIFDGNAITEENLAEANAAVKATAVMLIEVFQRLRKEKQLTEATSSSVAGLGIRSFLENKNEKFSGSVEENEELAQRVKAAEKEYFKKFPNKKRVMFQTKNKTEFKPKMYNNFRKPVNYDMMDKTKKFGKGPQGKPGPYTYRTCYRCKRSGHLIRDCPLPASPQGKPEN